MSPPDTESAPAAAAPQVSGVAATMTILAMGLSSSTVGTDPAILSTNLAAVRTGLHLARDTGSFVASLATLTGAATVLGAGTLGDLYGKKRMYIYGLLGAIGFDLMAAAAPNGLVLMAARAGIGVAFAFLVGLSLAIVNEVFAPDRRKAAIALFLASYYVIAAPLPAIGTWLVQQIGWRCGFLVAPMVALVSLAVVVRYVPETPRSTRRLDLVGLFLVAAALLGVVYGISQLQNGFTAGAAIPILVGLVMAAGFVFRELHVPYPALDLRIFASRRFNAALIAGVTSNFVAGGSLVLFAFYLVTVRNQSPEILGLLIIPAKALQALVAIGSGRAAARFGERVALVSGLAMLLAGLLMSTLLSDTTSTLVLFLALALISAGGAMIGTPQSTIMMASVPAELGGAVSGAKAALGQSGYSMGPALFATVGIWLFVRERNQRLAELPLTLDQAHAAFLAAHGGSAASAHGQEVLNPELAREVVQGAEQCMVDTIHNLSLIMAVVPALAIVAAVVLLPRKSAASPQ